MLSNPQPKTERSPHHPKAPAARQRETLDPLPGVRRFVAAAAIVLALGGLVFQNFIFVSLMIAIVIGTIAIGHVDYGSLLRTIKNTGSDDVPESDPEEAQLNLEDRVVRYARRGWSIQFQSPERAVLVKGKRPNHILHLLVSLFLLGLWVPVWIFLAVVKRERRIVLVAR